MRALTRTKSHISSVLRKLDLRDRVLAVVLATKPGSYDRPHLVESLIRSDDLIAEKTVRPHDEKSILRPMASGSQPPSLDAWQRKEDP